MHSLLRRQLRKLIPEGQGLPTTEQWATLLDRVSQTYAEADQDRYMLERSLQVSSAEMQQLYEELRTSSQATIDEKHARLEESLTVARAVQESVADGIVVIDENRTIVACNARFTAMWRLPEEVVPGTLQTTLARYMAAQVRDRQAYLDAVLELILHPDVVQHHDLPLLDGRIFERYAVCMRAADGRFCGWVSSYRDVTEPRRLLAERVVVADRMAAVGQLVAGVAHEINNPLCYVSGNVDHVRTEIAARAGLPPDLVEALDDARTGVERIRVIVRDLCTLSRVEEESGASTDVHEVLAGALQMAGNHIRHRAEVVRALQAVPPVSANEARLGQVLLNLLVNAAHAIPDGRASENTITVATRLERPGFVRIEVTDTGCGIEASHLERIFDPFFTTKPLGAGTGLGLSICKGLVTKMGGTIGVTSTVGKGSCFAVELPIAVATAAAATALEAAPAAVEAAAVRTRVLVVDDDTHVRRALDRALGTTYEVRTVASVDEALAALEGGTFDAILCDVMMPNRTGLDLHTCVTATHPELLPRLVFMSGGAFTPTLQAFFDRVPVRLDKPLDLRAVRDAIAQVATPVPPPR